MSSSILDAERKPIPLTVDIDWFTKVDELQKYLASEAASMMRSVPPSGRQGFQDLANQAPVILGHIQELEKLHQTRQDDADRYCDRWRRALSDRTGELGDLDKKVEQQHVEMERLGREIAVLASQRIDAVNKLAADKESSKRHDQSVLHEDSRLDERSAALDIRDEDLQSQRATLAQANEALNQSHRDLADQQEEERRREQENKKRAGKINRRLDSLANSQNLWEQQIAVLAAQVDELKVDNDGLRDTKLLLETRVATMQQEATSVQFNVKELSKLRTIEIEKAKLNASVVHLTGVTLPQKEAELNVLKAELAKTKDNTVASENELKSRISKLDAEKMNLQDQCQEQSTQIKELEEDHEFLQMAANDSSSKVQSADEKLTVAEATVGSLEMELDYTRKQNDGLEAEAKKLRLCRIDFDAAKRVQDASNAKIHELEQERDKIQDASNAKIHELEQERDKTRLDHNKVRQEFEKLQSRHLRMSDEARKMMALHDEAMKREEDKLDASQRRYHAAEQQREEVVEESNTAKAVRDHFAADNDRLRLQRDRLLNQVDALGVERDQLLTVNANIQQEKLDQSNILDETQLEVDRLTQQLQSCHCSDKRSSRKRRHDQVDSVEEEFSSADGSD